MKKHIIPIVFLFCIASSAYSQSNSSSDSFMCGNCPKVFNHIRSIVNNDSTAIEIIKRDYEISGNQSILNKSPKEIITFFNTDEGKKIICTYRKLSDKNTKVLLIAD